jgi:hypothetical protein
MAKGQNPKTTTPTILASLIAGSNPTQDYYLLGVEHLQSFLPKANRPGQLPRSISLNL